MLNLSPLTLSKSDAKSDRKTSKTVPLHDIGPGLVPSEEAWDCLGSLYQEMGKSDWLRLIRLGHIVKDPGSRDALDAVQSNKPAHALTIYEELLDAFDEDAMRDERILDSEACIWYEDKMACLESLGCWDVLHDQVHPINTAKHIACFSALEFDLIDPNRFCFQLLLELGDQTQLQPSTFERFTSTRNEDKHLSRYLRPFIRCCLFQPQHHASLAEVLDPLQGAKEKMHVLYTTTPAEIAGFRAVRSEWDAALSHIWASLQHFCRKWSATSLQNHEAKLQLLSLLQPLAETQEVSEL